MILRFARHTRGLHCIEIFYTKIIGLNKLGSFENHNGYNGIFLGLENTDWHLEFTASEESPKSVFDQDDALVQEIEIEPEQVDIFKVEYHQSFIKDWLSNNKIDRSFDEIWDIREKCIRNLQE